MNRAPKVSVISITFNQEEYIRETLDGFLMQKTNFDFEVIVADDCSTDKTAEIIRSYAKKYPKIFKPILRKENIGALENYYDALRTSRATYIALCEGDDYWTDNKKLQKQVDFLDNNSDYALCFHPVRVFFENNESKEYIFPDSKKTDLSIDGLLEANFIQTNSVMYRRQDYDNLASDIMPGDWYSHLFHAQFGKIGFINEVMSSYRRHMGGLWWDTRNNIDKIWLKYGIMQLAMFNELLRIFGKNKSHATIVRGSSSYLLTKFIELDKKYKSSLFNQVMEKFPNLITAYAEDEIKTVRELFDDRERLKLELEKVQELVRNKNDEIAKMKLSKFWKMKIAYEKIKNK